MTYLKLSVTLLACLMICHTAVAQVQKPEIPNEVRAELHRYVGTWEMTGTLGENELNGTIRVRWAPDRRYLLVRVACDGKQEFVSSLLRGI